MDLAHERLRASRVVLGASSRSSAVSLAYYAMLYAARAALSEEDAYAKTHVGTWGLFRETFVVPGAFEHGRPESRFDVFDGAAESWLRDAQTPGSARIAQLLGNGLKISQMPQIHCKGGDATIASRR